jgi:cysteine desulfurase
MNNPIYLDYNATTPIDEEVVKAMLPYLQTYYGNPSSSYSIGRQTKSAVNIARKQVANLINASPNEIIFTSGGTESNNHAIRGIAFANQIKGKHIITSEIEHPAVIEVCKYLETQGWEVTYVPVDKYGTVNPKDIENAIRDETTLITVMHANNEVGTIQPIEEIASLAQQNHITFHTDAAQSVGKINTDVKKMGIDLLTIAGHKLYAPKGIGALYIKEGTNIENLFYGAGQENGFRPGTENVPYIVALGEACKIAQRDFKQNTQNMLATKNRLIDGLKTNLSHNLHINGTKNNCLPNTLSVAFIGTEAHSLASAISNQLLISTGSACHANSIEISSVLKAMQVELMTAASTVRISTGKHTTNDEIDRAVEIITKTVSKLS